MAEVKAKQKAKKTKKHRKHGRSKVYCTRYALSRRREHNKIRRLKKHLARFPADKVAATAMGLAKASVGG